MSETSITTLIRGLKQGDHAAAEHLWVRYFDKLVAVARKKLSSVPKRTFDEEDVALSVFQSLCRGAEKGNFQMLTDREDLWALLLAITRQKAVDRIRHETGKKTRLWQCAR
jgi:DNA-directed RNA polymerase specialized sigma24 family protein